VIRNVLGVTLVLLLAVAGWSLWQQLDQPVARVQVQGLLTPPEQAAISAAVSESISGGLLSVDLAEVGARIRALSWPRTVQVRRIWPDTLSIRVEKESVVAAWGGGGHLTSAGKVVPLAEVDYPVPTLATTLSEPRHAMELYQLLAWRVGQQGFVIAALSENSLGEWTMTLDDGITVALGNQDLTARVDRFLLTYRQALARQRDRIAHVDARYANGVAVRWSEPLLALDAAARATPTGQRRD
jgi:cell division protein FtsQ